MIVNLFVNNRLFQTLNIGKDRIQPELKIPIQEELEKSEQPSPCAKVMIAVHYMEFLIWDADYKRGIVRYKLRRIV